MAVRKFWVCSVVFSVHFSGKKSFFSTCFGVAMGMGSLGRLQEFFRRGRLRRREAVDRDAPLGLGVKRAAPQ